MSPLHLHLALNHLPIVGMIFASVLFFWAQLRSNQSLSKVARTLMVVCGVLSIPVFLSGEPTEHSLEQHVQLQEATIEAHEEAAELAFAVLLVTSAVAAISLFPVTHRSALQSGLTWILLVSSVTSTLLLVRTGYLGGQIRHTELASAAAPGSAQMSGTKSDAVSTGTKAANGDTTKPNTNSDMDDDD